MILKCSSANGELSLIFSISLMEGCYSCMATPDIVAACYRLKKTGKRSEIFLATKFGFFSPVDKAADLAWVTENLDTSLSRLGVESVDLWYLHR